MKRSSIFIHAHQRETIVDGFYTLVANADGDRPAGTLRCPPAVQPTAMDDEQFRSLTFTYQGQLYWDEGDFTAGPVAAMFTPTLFALIEKADTVEIDGYEVDNCAFLPDGTVRLGFCDGTEHVRFADQTVSFDHGACNARSCADPEFDVAGDAVYALTFKVSRLLMPEDL